MFIALGSTLYVPVQARNTSDVPINADAAPRFQVYDGTTGSQLASASGQGAQGHTGTVTDATNATPIVITSAAHGLETGFRVTVASVGGNTAANGTFNITRVSASTFSLDGSVGNGAYTSGGTWNVAGFYLQDVVCTAGLGFASGRAYIVLSTWLISSSARSQIDVLSVS